jgi:uncharacterized protein with NAD-binding domain and iron-sulfur cluster
VTGRKIAVIGGGVSGLTAGYVLSRTDHVTLFEADRRLGGHADTHLVGAVPVDTGFIVYNERTYPLLTRLFAELGVHTRATEMSMSVRCADVWSAVPLRLTSRLSDVSRIGSRGVPARPRSPGSTAPSPRTGRGHRSGSRTACAPPLNRTWAPSRQPAPPPAVVVRPCQP